MHIVSIGKFLAQRFAGNRSKLLSMRQVNVSSQHAIDEYPCLSSPFSHRTHFNPGFTEYPIYGPDSSSHRSSAFAAATAQECCERVMDGCNHDTHQHAEVQRKWMACTTRNTVVCNRAESHADIYSGHPLSRELLAYTGCQRIPRLKGGSKSFARTPLWRLRRQCDAAETVAITRFFPTGAVIGLTGHGGYERRIVGHWAHHFGTITGFSNGYSETFVSLRGMRLAQM